MSFFNAYIIILSFYCTTKNIDSTGYLDFKNILVWDLILLTFLSLEPRISINLDPSQSDINKQKLLSPL